MEAIGELDKRQNGKEQKNLGVILALLFLSHHTPLHEQIYLQNTSRVGPLLPHWFEPPPSLPQIILVTC